MKNNSENIQLNEAIKNRWSPRTFKEDAVTDEMIFLLFEQHAGPLRREMNSPGNISTPKSRMKTPSSGCSTASPTEIKSGRKVHRC